MTHLLAVLALAVGGPDGERDRDERFGARLVIPGTTVTVSVPTEGAGAGARFAYPDGPPLVATRTESGDLELAHREPTVPAPSGRDGQERPR